MFGNLFSGIGKTLGNIGSGTGLFGKEGGFMGAFGTGQGALGKMGQGGSQFMGKFGTGQGGLSKVGKGGEGFMGKFGTGEGKLAESGWDKNLSKLALMAIAKNNPGSDLGKALPFLDQAMDSTWGSWRDQGSSKNSSPFANDLKDLDQSNTQDNDDSGSNDMKFSQNYYSQNAPISYTNNTGAFR